MKTEMEGPYGRTQYLAVLSEEAGYFNTDWKEIITAEAMNWLLERVNIKRIYVPTCHSDSTEYVVASDPDLTQEEVDEIRCRVMVMIWPEIVEDCASEGHDFEKGKSHCINCYTEADV